MNWFIWALLSAGFAAITAILAKVGVTEMNPNLATAIRTTVILVFTWVLAWVTCSRADWTTTSTRGWIFLIASGLATGLSWLCYFRALKLGDVSQVAPVDKLSVVLAILLAVVLLGERLTLLQSVGASLIVAGVILMGWNR